jgi:hypothetical protein
MPECIAKSAVPMLLARKWGNCYETRYEDASGTDGVYYEGRKLVALDMSLFNMVSRRATTADRKHMMLPGCPAPNWCLEAEWESEAPHNKSFGKVNGLFSYTGTIHTRIEEIPRYGSRFIRWLTTISCRDHLHMHRLC